MLTQTAAAREAGVTDEWKARIYVVRNSQIHAHYEQAKPRIMPIASRAISHLISTQAVGDLYCIYTITQRDGIDFNLIHIPDDFVSKAKETFGPEEMKRLYQLSYDMAKAGYKWHKTPPGLTRSASGSQ